MHPMMLEELMRMFDGPNDPASILMFASVVRDDIPWLYELAMEVYRAVKTGDGRAAQREMRRLRRVSEIMAGNPFAEELGLANPESRILAIEFPRMLEHMLMRVLEMEKIEMEKIEMEGNRRSARHGTVKVPSASDSKNRG